MTDSLLQKVCSTLIVTVLHTSERSLGAGRCLAEGNDEYCTSIPGIQIPVQVHIARIVRLESIWSSHRKVLNREVVQLAGIETTRRFTPTST